MRDFTAAVYPRSPGYRMHREVAARPDSASCGGNGCCQTRIAGYCGTFSSCGAMRSFCTARPNRQTRKPTAYEGRSHGCHHRSACPPTIQPGRYKGVANPLSSAATPTQSIFRTCPVRHLVVTKSTVSTAAATAIHVPHKSKSTEKLVSSRMASQTMAPMKQPSRAHRGRRPGASFDTVSASAMAPNRTAPNVVIAATSMPPGRELRAACPHRAMATLGGKLG
jgi:hypothetical protein